MIAGINQSKSWVKHISCGSKYNTDLIVKNVNQSRIEQNRC